MGTTPENQNQSLMASSKMERDPHSSIGGYPALDRTPSGNPVKPTDPGLTPRQSIHDPAHTETTQHGQMTTARDVSPPLPMSGPTPHGGGKTTSSHARELQRRLDNDVALREAIYADGQDPATFDISRGVSSRVGDGDSRTTSELKDDLARLSGDPGALERRAFDKAMGRG